MEKKANLFSESDCRNLSSTVDVMILDIYIDAI